MEARTRTLSHKRRAGASACFSFFRSVSQCGIGPSSLHYLLQLQPRAILAVTTTNTTPCFWRMALSILEMCGRAYSHQICKKPFERTIPESLWFILALWGVSNTALHFVTLTTASFGAINASAAVTSLQMNTWKTNPIAIWPASVIQARHVAVHSTLLTFMKSMMVVALLPLLLRQSTNATKLTYQMTARGSTIMQSKMGIWNTFITAARQREVRHQCAPDVLYVVEKVNIILP